MGEAITIRFGVRWGGPRRGLTLLAPVLLALALLASASSQMAATRAGETTSVIVLELAGSGDGPEQAVASLGGWVGRISTRLGPRDPLAGIIAGRDDSAPTQVQKGEDNHFVGMAPDARIVSAKVADAYGIADTSQVIAAIDWVVQHRRDNGMNIRVLNLSFGTDGMQDYKVDPLAYAAEVAWQSGIVVVVSGGNGGFGTSALNNPAATRHHSGSGEEASDLDRPGAPGG